MPGARNGGNGGTRVIWPPHRQCRGFRLTRVSSLALRRGAYPEVTKILGAQALDPMPMTVDELAARLKSNYREYERLITSTGAGTGPMGSKLAGR